MTNIVVLLLFSCVTRQNLLTQVATSKQTEILKMHIRYLKPSCGGVHMINVCRGKEPPIEVRVIYNMTFTVHQI